MSAGRCTNPWPQLTGEAATIAEHIDERLKKMTGGMELKPDYKQTEVGLIPEEWEVEQLGNLGMIVRGGSPRPAGNPTFFNGDFIPWLTVGSLTNIPNNQLIVNDTATKLTEKGAKHSRTL